MDLKYKTWSVSEFNEISDILAALEKQQVIKKVKPLGDQFISPFFLALKKDGISKRFILNLKQLNCFLQAPHFKLEDIRTAMKLISKNCFMATIDLKDAYYSISIHEAHRKYLRFHFNDSLWEFSSLPFGLSVAPFVFTKIMKPIVTYLRKQNITCVVYLDDCLIMADTEYQCSHYINVALNLFQRLGFTINYNKSNLNPECSTKFLGFILNSHDLTISLPEEKQTKILKFIKNIKNLKTIQIRSFAKFIGMLVASCPASKYGWLYTKTFEKYKYLALCKNNQNYNAKMPITKEILSDLSWWEKNIVNSKNNIRQDRFDICIYSDSSKTGWGAVCGAKRAHGWWPLNMQSFHINYLELKAAFLALQSFASDSKSKSILLKIDNTTAISYINRMGSIKYENLNSLAREIWEWCQIRDIWIHASYINSKDNWEADIQSRIRISDSEWELSKQGFQKIVRTLGKPSVDLFANYQNKKCDTFVSRFPDPAALSVDAFNMSWKNLNFYAFPPCTLVLRVLNKIILDQATGIVVIPDWPSQPFYPLFQKLKISEVIQLEDKDNLLLSNFRKSPHPKITLAAAVLSGKRSC